MKIGARSRNLSIIIIICNNIRVLGHLHRNAYCTEIIELLVWKIGTHLNQMLDRWPPPIHRDNTTRWGPSVYYWIYLLSPNTSLSALDCPNHPWLMLSYTGYTTHNIVSLHKSNRFNIMPYFYAYFIHNRT